MPFFKTEPFRFLASPRNENRKKKKKRILIFINPHFLQMVCNTPNYTHTIEDEYAQTESRIGLIADKLANNLISSGYKALSQSDNGLMAENAFDFETKTSALPHKTIAILSGIGYIGKNNLFITKEYGAA